MSSVSPTTEQDPFTPTVHPASSDRGETSAAAGKDEARRAEPPTISRCLQISGKAESEQGRDLQLKGESRIEMEGREDMGARPRIFVVMHSRWDGIWDTSVSWAK